MSEPDPFPCKDQIWEVIDGCDAQIQYLFTAPITFSGSGRLAAGERIRILSERTGPRPMVVSFLPLRYGELHDSLVPPDIRDTPRYKKYMLSVRTEYFYEHFRLIEDHTMSDKSNDDANFVSLGKFDYINSEHILKRFEEAGVRFRINEDDSPLRDMGPFRASLGGGFGTEQFIEIFTHRDDDAKVRAVMRTIFR
jgi:hypothetical protein